MKLNSIKFSEYGNDPRKWVMEGADFKDINLIVGANASGKTRVLNVINGLANLLSGKRKELYPSANYEVEFTSNDGKKYKYSLEINDNKIQKEIFITSRKKLLDRGKNGKGTIYAAELQKSINMQAPANELVVVSRRDKIQHPYFEELYKWAKSVKHFQFGTPLGRDRAMFIGQDYSDSVGVEGMENDSTRAAEIFQLSLERYGGKYLDNVINDMKELNYKCVEVGLATQKDARIKGMPAAFLYVQEEDMETQTTQINMSQGMFRALSLIIQLNNSKLSGKHTCILIDDIGEGLDYKRSTVLIEKIIEFGNLNGIQVIMTTNDRFVMNNVPLEYWSVINRIGQKVNIINKNNSPNVFDEYEFIGMNNFDFFSSGYYKGEKNDK